MSEYPEVDAVLSRARKVMAGHNVDVLWARNVANVSWLTQGVDVAVNTAADMGIASILLTADSAYILTDGIEAPRLKAEDKLEEKGFTVHAANWWERDDLAFVQATVPAGAKVGSDHPVSPEMVDLAGALSQERARLSPAEQDKVRDFGKRCAAAMSAAIEQVQQGMRESKLAAILDYEARARGMTPIVNLVAVDERIFNVRHPLPTDKELRDYAMLVLCGRREGLIISITRLLHFGPLPDEMGQKINACAHVDTAAIAATQPGATLSSIFDTIQQAYAEYGYADEWQLHHQGGLGGYAGRESFAMPGNEMRVEVGQIYAWNPSITGVKCEDTVLITEDGPEVITAIKGWPTITVDVGGQRIERPLILER